MHIIALFLITFNYTLFTVGAFLLFGRAINGARKRTFSSIGILASMLAIAIHISQNTLLNVWELSLGLLILVGSLGLFLYTAYYNIPHNYSPIHSEDPPEHLQTSGPYKWVRHPYYTAYLMTFVGGVWLSGNVSSIFWFILTWYIYTQAADKEERKFLESPFQETYLRYASATGRFLPTIWPITK